MVEQANVTNELEAEATKYRLPVAQLDQTYAVTPSRKAASEADARLAALPIAASGAAMAARGRALVREIAGLMTPRTSEIDGFVKTAARYDEERAAAKAWAASYDDLVHAHDEASQRYDSAQLVSEVAIVLASIALLLGSRPLWGVSLVGLVACGAMAGAGYAHAAESHAEHGIEEAKAHSEELRGTKDASGVRASERARRGSLAANPRALRGGHAGRRRAALSARRARLRGRVARPVRAPSARRRHGRRICTLNR